MINEYPVFHNQKLLGIATCYWNERGEAIFQPVGFTFPPNTWLKLIRGINGETRIELTDVLPPV